MKILLTEEDSHTVLEYFIHEQRSIGYKGPCFICLEKLEQLHMLSSKVVTQRIVSDLILSKS